MTIQAFHFLLLFSAISVCVVPKPKETFYGRDRIYLDAADFGVETASESLLLYRGISRADLFPLGTTNSETAPVPSLRSIVIETESDDETLSLETDESYSITILEKSAKITSKTVFGALYGLETFSQLIMYDKGKKAYYLDNTPLTINDSPRFKWRGLMIDTARHYYTLDILQKMIDVMASVKFNTLHWHLVDAESFPFEVPEYNKLSEEGSWHSKATYSENDIRSMVSYAKDRGIRIVPEFDIPGHCYQMKSYGITAQCPSSLAGNINNYPLNPSLEDTYTIVQSVISRLNDVFAEPFIHLGGDEISSRCWTEDPSISSWMGQQGFNYRQALQYFIERSHKFAFDLGKSIVVWQDLFDSGIEENIDTTIIQVWLNKDSLSKALKKGYRALLSRGYYLDVTYPLTGSFEHSFQDTWKDMYLNEPFDELEDCSEEELNKIIGGEAAIWSEKVDRTNIETTVWPRAAAVAERMWSEKTVRDVKEFGPRLSDWACAATRRGFKIAPVTPNNFCLLKN